MAARGRQTITMRIALDGGQEIKKELEALGVAGEVAFKKLQAAANSLKIGTGVSAGLRQIQKDLEATGEKVTALGRKIETLGRGFSIFASLPAGLLGKGLVSSAADFQSAMNNVGIALQKNGTELKEFDTLARQLGKTTLFSAKEAATAIAGLAQAGAPAEKILGGMAKAALDLATVTGGPVPAAVRGMTDAMGLFNIKAEDSQRAVKAIAGSLLESKFEFADFINGLGQAGSTAAASNLQLEDLLLGLAGTAKGFTSGSDAGTSFKTFLQRLTPTTKEAQKVQQQLGLELRDSRTKQFKPFVEIIGELQRAFGKLDPKAMREAAQDFFGTDAIRTFDELMKLTPKRIKEVQDSMRDFDVAGALAAKMGELNGQIKRFNNALAELGIAIGKTGILDDITQLVTKVTELVEQLSQSSPEVLRWTGYLIAAVAVLGPLTVAVGAVVAALGYLTSAVGKAVGNFAKLVPAGSATEKLFTRLAFLPRLILGPWGQLALFLIAFWDDIKQAAAEFWDGLWGDPAKVKQDWIASWSSAILEFQNAISKLMKGDFSGAWDDVKQAGEHAWTGIKEIAATAIGAMILAIGGIQLAWKAAGVASGINYAAGFAATWAAIRTAGNAVATFLVARFGAAGAAAGAAFSAGFARGAAIGGTIGRGILALITRGGPLFILIELLLAINQHWDDIVAGFEKGVNLDNTTNKVEGFWANVGKGARVALEFFKKTWEVLPDTVQRHMDEAQALLDQAWENIKSAASNALQFIINDWNAGIAAWRDLGQKIGAALIDGFSTFVKQLKEIAELAVAVWERDWGKVKDIITRQPLEAFKIVKQGASDLQRSLEESLGLSDPERLNPVRGVADAADRELARVQAIADRTSNDARLAILQKGRDVFKDWGDSGVSEMARVRDALMHPKKAMEEVQKAAVDAGTTMVRVFQGGKWTEFSVPIHNAKQALQEYSAEGERVVRVHRGIAESANETGKKGKEAGDKAKKAAEDAGDGWTEFKVKAEQSFEGIPQAAKNAAQQAVAGARLEWKQLQPGVWVLDEVKKSRPFDPLVAQAREAKERAKTNLKDAVPKAEIAADAQAAAKTIPDATKPAVDKAKQDLATIADPLKKIPAEAKPALDSLQRQGETTAKEIFDSFQKIKDFDWTKLGEGAAAAWREIASGAATATEAVKQLKAILDTLPFAALQTAAQGATLAFQTLIPLLQSVQSVTTNLLTAIETKTAAIAEAVKAAQAAVAGPPNIQPAREGGAPSNAPPPAGDAAANAAASPFAAIVQQAQAAFDTMKAAAAKTIEDIKSLFAGMEIDWSPVTDRAATAFSLLGDEADRARTRIEEAFAGIEIDWSSLTNGLVEITATIFEQFANLADQISATFSQIGPAVQAAMADAVAAVSSAAAEINAVLATVEAAIRAVAAAAQDAANTQAGGGGGGGNELAAGGPVRGPGGPTSDSIPIWASAGEFVLRAAAVKRYGLKFLAALNKGRFDPRKLRLGRFAQGGLVDLPRLRRFAEGGLVQRPARMRLGATRTGRVQARERMTPVNLSINGMAMGQVMAPAGTARALSSYAQAQQIRSAGRKPGWY